MNIIILKMLKHTRLELERTVSIEKLSYLNVTLWQKHIKVAPNVPLIAAFWLLSLPIRTAIVDSITLPHKTFGLIRLLEHASPNSRRFRLFRLPSQSLFFFSRERKKYGKIETKTARDR